MHGLDLIDGEFLDVARLMAMLFLRLSGTVEHVVSLTLSCASARELQIDFIGVRARVYASTDPSCIEVHGTGGSSSHPPVNKPVGALQFTDDRPGLGHTSGSGDVSLSGVEIQRDSR